MKEKKPKYLTCNCDACGLAFPVLKRTSQKLQLLILNFAICPHCKTARFPDLHKRFTEDKKCVICKIPLRMLNYCGGARGLCGRCYVIERLEGDRQKYPCVLQAMRDRYDLKV